MTLSDAVALSRNSSQDLVRQIHQTKRALTDHDTHDSPESGHSLAGTAFHRPQLSRTATKNCNSSGTRNVRPSHSHSRPSSRAAQDHGAARPRPELVPLRRAPRACTHSLTLHLSGEPHGYPMARAHHDHPSRRPPRKTRHCPMFRLRKLVLGTRPRRVEREGSRTWSTLVCIGLGAS